MDELQPSPMKNVTSGAGCGCGCLGLLVGLGGGFALAAVPLGFYGPDPSAAPVAMAVGALAVGCAVFLLGAVVWIGSLFLD